MAKPGATKPMVSPFFNLLGLIVGTLASLVGFPHAVGETRAVVPSRAADFKNNLLLDMGKGMYHGTSYGLSMANMHKKKESWGTSVPVALVAP